IRKRARFRCDRKGTPVSNPSWRSRPVLFQTVASREIRKRISAKRTARLCSRAPWATSMRFAALPGFALLTFALNLSVLFAGPLTSPVVIDGRLDDAFWSTVSSAKLVATEAGVPTDLGGEVRVAIRGRYLYVGARLPEPEGRLTARSTGRNPVWE